MVKVNVDIPDDVHYIMKRIQLDLEMQGEKKQLKELYAEVIKEAAQRLRSQIRQQREPQTISQ